MPVTGANDSHFIVHIVKNILGMNPLLVNYNKYFNTPIGISNLANLRLKFDLDILANHYTTLLQAELPKEKEENGTGQ